MFELAGSKTPLVYDVQELYRWTVDLSIINLLENHKLRKSDFLTTENYHTRLLENTAKLLLDCLKDTFNTRAAYKKKQHTYQNVLQDNVQNLANYILDKQKELRFNMPSVQIKRNDDLEMRIRYSV